MRSTPVRGPVRGARRAGTARSATARSSLADVRQPAGELDLDGRRCCCCSGTIDLAVASACAVAAHGPWRRRVARWSSRCCIVGWRSTVAALARRARCPWSRTPIATRRRCPSRRRCSCSARSAKARTWPTRRQAWPRTCATVIRARLTAGASDQQILDEFVASYGDGILTEPPKRGISLGVWIGPLIGVDLRRRCSGSCCSSWRRAPHAVGRAAVGPASTPRSPTSSVDSAKSSAGERRSCRPSILGIVAGRVRGGALPCCPSRAATRVAAALARVTQPPTARATLPPGARAGVRLATWASSRSSDFEQLVGRAARRRRATSLRDERGALEAELDDEIEREIAAARAAFAAARKPAGCAFASAP